ncbi:MAG: hydantoinase B/oxoprolinase family protein [Pseudonocardiaceae bacterium]
MPRHADPVRPRPPLTRVVKQRLAHVKHHSSDHALLLRHPRGYPDGGRGWHPGAVGRNTLRRADGTEVELPSKGTWPLRRGDRIRIETPGGGGWGTENH